MLTAQCMAGIAHLATYTAETLPSLRDSRQGCHFHVYRSTRMSHTSHNIA